MLKNLKIGQRLAFGFAALILIMLFQGIFSLDRISVLSDLTENLYKHPMAVQHAVDRIELNTVKINRSMKDVALATSNEEIDAQMDKINGFEKEIYEDFDLLSERFLGDKNLYLDSKELIVQYRPIRMEVVGLIKNGEREKATFTIKTKGGDQVTKISESLKKLNEFTDSKAKIFFDNASEVNRQSVIITYILLITSLALVILITISLTKSITKPVNKVLEIAKELSDGNLNVKIDMKRKDEMGQLLDAMSNLVIKLKGVMSVIKNGSENLLASANELSEISSQVASSSNEVSAQVSTAAASGEQVSANVTTVSASSEEMASSIKEISGNTETAARLSKESQENAGKATVVMNRLETSSQEIGNIVKVITSIAEQTNLLALNATIEAARAGESGKGFAVVANEVKELAKESAKATEDITNRIKAIQEDSKNAINVINGIVDNIKQVNDISNTIASAVEEQSVSTSEVNRNLSEASRGVTSLVEVNSGIAEQVSGFSKMAANLKSHSGILHGLAIELENQIKNNFVI